jgi:hypothetical protein
MVLKKVFCDLVKGIIFSKNKNYDYLSKQL